MGEQLVLFDAVLEGEVVASALCLAGGQWLHYHLGAMADRAREVGRGQSPALRGSALGSGARASPSSTWEAAPEQAKTRSSPSSAASARTTSIEYWIGKIVHDEGAYRRLTGGAEIDFEGFFPAYRLTARASNQAVSPSAIAKSDAEQTCQLSEANGSS